MTYRIFTAANAPYFPLCKQLLATLPESATVFDLGFEPAQRDELLSLGHHVITPQWPFPKIPQEHLPEWFGAMAVRPHLHQYADGADVCCWIDSDAWVQRFDPIREMIHTAHDTGRLAIVREEYHDGVQFRLNDPDTGQPRTLKIPPEAIQQDVTECYLQCFGETIARELGPQPSYNTGLFALRTDSPTWRTWSKHMLMGLSRSFHKLVEQQSLNLAIHKGLVEPSTFPLAFNYLFSNGLPHYSKEGLFVTAREGTPIALLHLSDLKHAHSLPLRIHGTEETRLIPIHPRD